MTQQSLFHRMLWFAAIWMGSVLSLTIVAFAIRLVIGTG